ncbi:hypothetical protein PUNSTDRAFT_53306 [Punctularia strigosozonata HHB-11173 SS5]|uniref:uncharacterized protein n=1 Tax=Punctularia strigosozonata (strain HHB-11173) TaxID=741275 RepID=UPI0004417092|nr:uncharacterized protein PUNSTDRAFT_53306 [Punctularia strigosozonata HHB-11173 SS5]EIN07996.1 hypothetical protein PUNSTDRAFT_53306 [Punctularia strigosozonata HHB-11173 SS5]
MDRRSRMIIISGRTGSRSPRLELVWSERHLRSLTRARLTHVPRPSSAIAEGEGALSHPNDPLPLARQLRLSFRTAAPTASENGAAPRTPHGHSNLTSPEERAVWGSRPINAFHPTTKYHRHRYTGLSLRWSTGGFKFTFDRALYP